MEDLNNQAENTGAAGTTEAAAPAAPKAPGVGDVAKQLIRDGLGNKEVLEKVQAQFPESKISMASVNWYRNHLRGLGEDVKTARELSAAGKPTAEEKQAAKDAAKAEKKAASDKAKAEKKAQKEKEKADAKAAKEAVAAAAKQQPAAEAGEQPAAEAGEGFLS